MEVVGILGGTFNPVHLGHIQMAVCAHEQFNIPNILIMPSGSPSSYKDTSIIAPAMDRCAMIELAIRDYPYMSLSTLEIDRAGATYTSDTLKALRDKDLYIYFIIGADSLFMLDKWHEAEYVMRNCHFLAVNRESHPEAELESRLKYLRENFGAKIDLLKMNDMPMSSSEIRELVRSGESIKNMVSESVEAYIKEHGLYSEAGIRVKDNE
jgi:nicotinate-nucleotide adenylyltransferase